MSKVFVTGIAGFLGSHLCASLLAKGHQVTGVDNFMGGELENIPDGVTFLHGDCCELARMRSIIRPGTDIVFHCAAAPHEGLSVFSPTVVTQHTYMSTVAVATAAIAAGVKRLVFMSSMSRYGKGQANEYQSRFAPFSEDSPCSPVDPYGIAKVASEQALLCLGRAHGMEIVIVVPHNAYGPRQRYCDPYRNVVGIMMNLMLHGRAPIIYGDGEQQRCFSYVDDVIGPIVRAGFTPGLDGEIINVGPDDEPVTINQLVAMLAEVMQYTGPAPVHYTDRPCEVKHAWPSSDKARRLLGYESRTKLREGLGLMAEWIKARGAKDFIYHLPVEIVSDRTPITWKDRIF